MVDKGYLYLAVKEIRPGKKDEKVEIEDDYGYIYKRFFSYYYMEELESLLKNCKMKILNRTVTPAGISKLLEIICQKV